MVRHTQGLTLEGWKLGMKRLSQTALFKGRKADTLAKVGALYGTKRSPELKYVKEKLQF